MTVRYLHNIPNNAMLNISAQWLENPEFRQTLEGGGHVGKGVLQQLEGAHEGFADLQHQRDSAHARLRQLIDLITRLDILHDRKARSLYYSFDALIEGADDDQEIAQYRELQQALFPKGLRVIRLPFAEQGGAAVALDRAVGPELRAKLEAISVGPRTLLDLFEAWIKAGLELGKAVQQRAELRASLSAEGSVGGEIDLRVGRKTWLQAVRGLLWAIESSEALRGLEEPVVATLEEAVGASRRQRDDGEAPEPDDGEAPAPDEDVAPEPDDEAAPEPDDDAELIDEDPDEGENSDL